LLDYTYMYITHVLHMHFTHRVYPRTFPRCPIYRAIHESYTYMYVHVSANAMRYCMFMYITACRYIHVYIMYIG